ncbi:hypothetical protein CLD22_19480 [Rubrivivax gelatinosus]|nr:hypothetical protein [Rubrivivax gelatinosus]
MKTLVHGWRRLAALAGALLLAVGAARADTVLLASTPTTLSGSETRMISYRHQNHMWQTEDGYTHLVANVGVQPGGAALRMFSSADGGVSWTAGIELANTDGSSTLDGFLAGGTLYVAYAQAGGAISFANLKWDLVTASWRIVRTEPVFSSATVKAVNPAVARDGVGRFWLGFTTLDASTGLYALKLMRRTSTATGWVDSGLQFGTPDSLGNERSVRPVAIAGGMGMVYSEHGVLYWARRLNSWPEDRPWPVTLIRTPVGSDVDPYGSHFSVAVDAQSNVHLALADSSKLWYARLLNATQEWRSYMIAAPVQVAYMQMVVSGGTLMMIANNKTLLSVYQSVDTGASFALTHVLTHPVGDADYSNPRNEAPSNPSSNPVPVLQQYVDGTLQRLMSFRVPVATGTAAR